MVRGRPSGLKAAAHRLRRRPAAGRDPGASAAPGGRNQGPGHRPAPRPRTAPRHRPPHRVWWTRKDSSTGTVATTPWTRAG